MTSPDSPVVIILGATGGIGSEVVNRLSARGCNLVLAARNETNLSLLATRTGAMAIPTDATDPDQVQALVQQTVQHFGRIDAVVNCVGSILLKPAHLTSIDEYRETMALNLDSAFFVVKHVSRAMMKTGGSIVLCSSAVARTGLFNHEAIAAAKSGIEGLVRAAAATYAQRGIRVNCVAPGLVETPLSARLTANEASRATSEAMHALGKLGTPGDVAEAIDWLVDGTRSSWVTGQVIGVDGGLGSVRPR